MRVLDNCFTNYLELIENTNEREKKNFYQKLSDMFYQKNNEISLLMNQIYCKLFSIKENCGKDPKEITKKTL